jgi:hypothetical protein
MRRNTVSYGLPLVLETTSERNLEPNETEETSETATANIVGYERVSSVAFGLGSCSLGSYLSTSTDVMPR